MCACASHFGHAYLLLSAQRSSAHPPPPLPQPPSRLSSYTEDILISVPVLHSNKMNPSLGRLCSYRDCATDKVERDRLAVSLGRTFCRLPRSNEFGLIGHFVFRLFFRKFDPLFFAGMSTRSQREKSSKNTHHTTILTELLREEPNRYCADCGAKG